MRTIFTQTASWLGLRMHADNLFSVLPLDYHTQEPLKSILTERRTVLSTADFDCLCLENADRDGVALLAARGDYRGFHVIRDPRDILVSAYFSHRHSHPVHVESGPWIQEFREQLAATSNNEEGLLLELDFCAAYFENMATWDYHNPRVFEIRYETMIADPVATLCRAYEFLGIQVPTLGIPSLVRLLHDRRRWKSTRRPMPRRACLPRPLLRVMVHRHRFSRKSGGRRRGEEDAGHHYRKGIPGDWRNRFTPAVAAAFKARYGDLLIRLGYESNTNW